ncbi:MAG: hypothetical protein HY608_07365 [Planctomycetes bacterium]|nr:hypothetical protein [Planctomycetota bacterium]
MTDAQARDQRIPRSPIGGFLMAAALMVGAIGGGSYLLGKRLVRARVPSAENEAASVLLSVRPGLDRIKREVAGCLPLLNQDEKGNGQRFVLISGTDAPFDEIQCTTTVPDPRSEYRTTTHVRYYVGNVRADCGDLMRDLWDRERDDWRNEPEILCEGLRTFRVRYMNDPRGHEYGERTSRRLFEITAHDGYDSKDASGRWTGVNPYLKGDRRLVLDGTDLENPDRGPLPSRLQIRVAAENPDTGQVVACPPMEIAIHTSQ